MTPLEICEYFDIRNQKGLYAVNSVMGYMHKVRTQNRELFDNIDDIEKGVLRKVVVGILERTAALAELDHEVAMSHKRVIVKGRRLIEVSDPQLSNAKEFIDTMRGSAEALSKLVVEPNQQQSTMNNPVFGDQKITILGLPKSVPSRPTPTHLIEAKRESA